MEAAGKRDLCGFPGIPHGAMSLLDESPARAFIVPVSASAGKYPSTPFIPNAMKIRLFTGFAAALCLLMASCYPYPENPQQKKANRAPNKTETAEQVKLKEQESLKKQQEEELKKTQEAAGGPATQTPPETPSQPQTTPPPVEPKRTDYAFANKVPGKEGFVFSPYNNKVVDVRDIPSGTLVQDPTYPASEKKYFRVP